MGNKKQNDNFNELAHGFEGAIALGIESAINGIMKYFANAVRGKKSNDTRKITPDYLFVKEDWHVKDAFAYSLTTKKEIFLDQFDLDRSTFVCAMTGAGKNVVLDGIIENRIKNDNTIIYLSPKGDYNEVLSFRAVNSLYKKKALVLSPDHLDTVKYNPLANGEASSITDRVFSSFEWGEPYYADCNYAAIQGAVRNILDDEERGEVTVKNLLQELIEKFNTNETTNIINKLSKIHYSAYGRLLSPEKNDPKRITLSELSRNGSSIMVSLSTLGHPEVAGQIGKMLTYDLMEHAHHAYSTGKVVKNNNARKITLVVDEFGSIATTDIINLINKGRGAGIGVCAATQTLADLDKVGEFFRDQFLGNCQNFIIGKAIVPMEADYWSKFIGTNMISKITQQTEEGELGPRGSIRDANEYRVDPNTIKELGIGQFVLCSYMPKYFIDVAKIHYRDSSSLLEEKKRIESIKKNKSNAFELSHQNIKEIERFKEEAKRGFGV